MLQRLVSWKTHIGAALAALSFWSAPAAQAQDAPVTLSFYGVPGIVDLPSGEALPDGTLAFGISHFAGQTRTSVTFQFSPRISGTFRYIGIQDWNSDGFDTYRDRSFDARFLIAHEGRIRPAITVGLQDFAGTGIYAAEYVTATKNFDRPFFLPGNFKVTAGLGWGRLGTLGSIGAPFPGNRARFSAGDTGGELSYNQWFRGDAAPFGGVEWQVNDKLGLKLEYSSDAYTAETQRDVFERKSRLNFGAEYQWKRFVRVGGYYLYGSELGVNVQIAINPKQAPRPFTIAGPLPVIVRPSRDVAPETYATNWEPAKAQVAQSLGDIIGQGLTSDGIRLERFTFLSATRVEARVASLRYLNNALVVGRTARRLAGSVPASVETFDVIVMVEGLPTTRATISRSDLEQLEFQPGAADLLLSRSTLDSAPGGRASEDAYVPKGTFPRFSWSLGPYLRPSFFDSTQPIRADFGISLAAEFRPAPGWLIAGDLRHRLAGNIEDSLTSPSALPPVRTNARLYAQEGETSVEELFVAKQWKVSKNVYARATVGYLEQMFGGISTEVVWQRPESRLALGLEANYVKQRDFDGGFGFQDYSVATGHLSAYYDFGKGYVGQLDVGRYLAGDVGATLAVDRTFENGWSVGGFFTLTDVSAEDFGEGSFDKGLRVTIPLQWLTGQPRKRTQTAAIRPVQRDGGARLNVAGRLYPQLRDADVRALREDWGRVWE